MLGINGSTVIIPSIEVKSIDSTGAGDAFVGAVLYQLNESFNKNSDAVSNEQWKQIVLNGNKAGARTCEYMGAMEAFKFLNKQIFE